MYVLTGVYTLKGRGQVLNVRMLYTDNTEAVFLLFMDFIDNTFFCFFRAHLAIRRYLQIKDEVDTLFADGHTEIM